MSKTATSPSAAHRSSTSLLELRASCHRWLLALQLALFAGSGCSGGPGTVVDAGDRDQGSGDQSVGDVGTEDLAVVDVGADDGGPGDVGTDDMGPGDQGPGDLGVEDVGPGDLGLCVWLTGQACDGVGACGDGVLECDGAGDSVCSTHPGGSADQSSTERCNGLDDDCDDAIDEGFALGTACDGIGACGVGTVQCDPSDVAELTAICSTEPGGTQNQAAANDLLCNGTDDDCDGAIDEDRGVGQSCDGEGACGEGVLECATLNTTRCSTDPGGSVYMGAADRCDDLDNDCDSFVDEGYGTGASCSGSCGEGIVECDTLDTVRCSSDDGCA